MSSNDDAAAAPAAPATPAASNQEEKPPAAPATPAAGAVSKAKAEAEPRPQSPATPSTPGTPGGTPSFKAQFRAFSKFGDTKSDGKHITLSQSDKWMKQAKVIDGKKITTTDTGIYFKKFKQQKLGVDDYMKFLEDLAKNKKIEADELKNKMSSCGAPGLTTSSAAAAAAAAKVSATVDRLTDTTRYTGAHKQRFDQAGRGKGLAGRKDVPDTAGYVQGYQNKNTYDKTH